ncbi:hypothetical protein Dimus_006782 [Dionaea muscipula]
MPYWNKAITMTTADHASSSKQHRRAHHRADPTTTAGVQSSQAIGEAAKQFPALPSAAISPSLSGVGGVVGGCCSCS